MGDIYPRLKPEHFDSKPFGFVYEASVNLYNNGIPMDLTLLEEEMRRIDPAYYNEINGIDAVKDYFGLVLDGCNMRMYADHIIEGFQRRKLSTLSTEMRAKAVQYNLSMQQILEDTTLKMQQISCVGVDNSTIRQVSQIGEEVIAKH